MQSVLAENINPFSRDTLVRQLMLPFAQYLEEPGVTEVVINKPYQVYTEKGAEWHAHEAPGMTMEILEQLATAIANFTDQEIGPAKPILSAMLPDGERVQIIVPPAVEPGTISFTIRKPSPSIKSLEEYEKEGAFSRYRWAKSAQFVERKADLERVDLQLVELLETNRFGDFLRLAAKSRKNILVVGDTGSGKTTLMKTICQYIPHRERLITIEDVREMFLPKHDNRVHLLYSKGGQGVARVTPSDLIASNMRMKPDRVLMAELRGGEAFDFLKLMTTGHRGSISSAHAESCALAEERYVFMCKENEQASIYDADALKKLVRLTIDIIIHVVAEVLFDDNDQPIKKERYVSEVKFDPVAKLIAEFGDATIHRGGAR